MENENPIRVLRKALGMTQHRFATELKCSYSSVQGYEGGRNVPAAMLKKMAAIARNGRLPDLADELSTWQSQTEDADPATAGYNRKNKRWHTMLEAILESGDPRMKAAVQSNLSIFYAFVMEKSPVDKRKRRRQSQP